MQPNRHLTGWIAGGLLLVMAILMVPAAIQDSATVDETTFLASGYTYWTGHRYRCAPEHPPGSQMLPAIPLLLMDLRYSRDADALLTGKVGYPWARPWFGPIRAWQEYFPQGRDDNWYYWWLPESQLFGQMFVYDGTNNGNAMLLAGRCVQIALALGVGLVIFFWVRAATGQDIAALAGLALWVFNPNALAHGHLVTTDISVTLAMSAAIYLMARFLEDPTDRNILYCGIATGVALLMKFTAITLAPIYLVLVALSWRRLALSPAKLLRFALIGFAATWAVILIVNFPHWIPAPPLPAAQATALGVPGWFQTLRPLLIPPDFFKGLALTLGHSRAGHEGYLLGEWSHDGWWYYYPVAFCLKSPVAFLILLAIAAGVFVKQFRNRRPLEYVPWLAVAVFVFLAMTSKVNIGVRHLLPVIPLLCIGIGCAIPAIHRRLVGGLLIWQVIVTTLAFPTYLPFMSEAVGGAQNGHRYLLDSNYDWGQDANRLKQFLSDRGIEHIYLDYFGTQYNIEYLKIPNTRVNADQAKQIRQGWLVVSASQLMRPEWAWLRDSRPPTYRVAHTLFVYQL